MADLFAQSGAILSDCKLYRYRLWRIWDEKKPLVLFIMLNPSTADAMQDDPTIRRCINFAHTWGYGGIMVGNLFAYRSTDPKELLNVENPVGEDNNRHILEMHAQCKLTVCAWGNVKTKAKPLIGIDNSELYYLELTNSNNPRHPLYVKGDVLPKKFDIQEVRWL